MGQPREIAGYEAEWMVIARHLEQHGNMTLQVNDKVAAARLRFRFYGFRRAMARHDPTNPWVAVMMETQAQVTPEGNVHLERSPYSALLRGLLEHSTVTLAPKVEVPTEEVKEAGTAHQDATILALLSGKKPE